MKSEMNRSASVGMFYLWTIAVITIAIMLTSCGSTKYQTCDAYKTKYKPLKADHHKRHHHTCDAYN